MLELVGGELVERHVEGFDGLSRARVTTLADRPFPLQLDGDYIGEFDSWRTRSARAP